MVCANWIGGFVLLLTLLVCGSGCREWRQQSNDFHQKQREAGALIGKSPEEVVKALGKPSMVRESGENTVYVYSYMQNDVLMPMEVGRSKHTEPMHPVSGNGEVQAMRIYFKGGKMIGVDGN